MITSAYDIPFDGHWRWAGGVFQYPLVTVFAASQAQADLIAAPTDRDVRTAIEVGMDAAEASLRLGHWGRPDLDALMRRGD